MKLSIKVQPQQPSNPLLICFLSSHCVGEVTLAHSFIDSNNIELEPSLLSA